MRRGLAAPLVCTLLAAAVPAALRGFADARQAPPPAAVQAVAPVGKLTEGVLCPSDPSQTYSVYLPSTYTNSRTWPLLFVFDPGGRGARAVETFREAAERFGWIVVGSENSRNGPWEPTRRSITAMWPAVLQTYTIARDRVYAGGHSGGAAVAWMLATESGQIAGVVASGPPNPGSESKPSGFAWFGTAGRLDFNFIEARTIDARVARAGAPHRMEFFDGGHQWLPAPLTMRALGWLEVVAMKQQRRPLDERLAARVLDEDLARARDLEGAGFLTDAHRNYSSIVDSYSGIVDTSEARTRARALEADERFKRARRDEQRADDRERARLEALTEAISQLYRDDALTLPVFRQMLGIRNLQNTAKDASYEAGAARRSLETIYMPMAGELPRDLEGKKNFVRAAWSLEIASEIHPERPRVWFELAAARAASGFKGPAIEALQRAVAAGFKDRAAIMNDERLATLRSAPAFLKLVEQLQ